MGMRIMQYLLYWEEPKKEGSREVGREKERLRGSQGGRNGGKEGGRRDKGRGGAIAMYIKCM